MHLLCSIVAILSLASFCYGLRDACVPLADNFTQSCSDAPCNYSDVSGIIGRSTKYRAPYLVGILDTISSKKIYVFCEGGLIAGDWVLTTASCFLNTERKMQVFMGTNCSRLQTPSPNQSRIYIGNGIRLTIHPQFNDKTLVNNVALLKLPYKVVNSTVTLSTVANICLEKTPVDFNTILTGISWGLLYNSDTISGGDRVIKSSNSRSMSTISNATCNTYFANDVKISTNRNLREDLMCTECFNKTQKRTIGEVCQSNQGSLAVFNKTGTVVLVGLLHAVGCPPGCQENFPVVYVRISKCYDWIASLVPEIKNCTETTSPSPSNSTNTTTTSTTPRPWWG